MYHNDPDVAQKCHEAEDLSPEECLGHNLYCADKYGNILKQYVRDNNLHKRGVVIGYIDVDGTPMIGWSLCMSGDTKREPVFDENDPRKVTWIGGFNPDRAVYMAFQRARPATDYFKKPGDLAPKRVIPVILSVIGPTIDIMLKRLRDQKPKHKQQLRVISIDSVDD